MCIKIRNLSWKVISSAAYRGKATQHCKESFACAWRDTGGGVTGSRGKFLRRCVWNVLGNLCNLIHKNMRFVINHFRTEIKIMQFKYHYIKKIDRLGRHPQSCPLYTIPNRIRQVQIEWRAGYNTRPQRFLGPFGRTAWRYTNMAAHYKCCVLNCKYSSDFVTSSSCIPDA